MAALPAGVSRDSIRAVYETLAGGGVSAAGIGSGTAANKSGSITTGGTAQVLAAANTARTMLVGQNISSGDLWINEIGGTATADTAGSYRVPSGAGFQVNTALAISIVGATTGQKFTATEKTAT